MSEPRPGRTIYRSAAAGALPNAGGARPEAGVADPSARRRRLREAWWLAPLLALLVLLVAVIVASFFLLGGFSLLQYFGITTSGQSYAGTWGLSDPALGSSVVHIAKAGGDTYTLTGVRVLGESTTTARVSDDQLKANGSVNGVTWQLSLSFADRDQLHATIDYGDGRPPLETLLTRQ
jgi:hypothetical protein